MEKKPDELFLLVSSLDKNEKGYFRKFCRIYSNSEEGNYLRLFDCLSKMEEYDEVVIRQKFAGEKFLQQLGVTKHYLKNLIIRALRNYYDDQFPRIGRLASFMDAYVMLKKGLTESACNRAKKELAAAIKAEYFVEVLLWADFLQTLHVQSGEFKGRNDPAANSFTARMSAIKQYENLAEYENLTARAMKLDVYKGDATGKEASLLLKHPLLASVDAALSGKAKMMYANVLSKIYRSGGELNKATRVLNEVASHFESTGALAGFTAINHFVLYNEMLNNITRQNIPEMEDVVYRAKNLVTVREKDFSALEKQLAESCITEHEINLLLYKKEPQKALKSLQNSPSFKKETLHSKLVHIELAFFKAWAYLQLKEFDKALDAVNDGINFDYEEYTYVIQELYLLNILIHLELGNFSIMKRQFALAENFVKKYEHNYHINMHIVSGLKQISKHTVKKDNAALKKSITGLAGYLNNEKTVQKAYLEIWLESKLKA